MASLYKRVTKGEFKPIPRQYSDELRDIISRMLNIHPKDRISLRKYIPKKRASDFRLSRR